MTDALCHRIHRPWPRRLSQVHRRLFIELVGTVTLQIIPILLLALAPRHLHHSPLFTLVPAIRWTVHHQFVRRVQVNFVRCHLGPLQEALFVVWHYLTPAMWA